MKNILKNIILGGAVVVLAASCDLDPRPTTAIVIDEGKPIFTSVSDIESFRNGVLASYRGLHYGVFSQSTEVMCDGFNSLISYGNNYGSVHRTDATFTTSDSYAESMWASHYGAIKNYNIAIEQSDLILDPESEFYDESLVAYAEWLKGTALYCRASSYLNLARHFGPDYDPDTAADDLCVPLVLEFDIYAKPARASVEDVYYQIEEDLLAAEELLDGKVYQGEQRSPDVTIDAIYALLARYYLDIEEYEEAAKMADAVIGSEAGYKLSSTATEMTAEFSKDSGSEPIIQFYASNNEGLAGNPIYTQVSRDAKGAYFQPYYIPSKKLIDSYSQNDLRFRTWFSNNKYPIFANGARYKNIYTFIKYIGNPAFQMGTVENGAHAAKALMISEMYLISAEAHLMANSPINARTSLNALQNARGADPTAATLENIQLEWFKETVGEGLRLTCLKRWHIGFEGRPAQNAAVTANIVNLGEYFDERKIEADDYVLCWPIPSYELKLNKNLEQNDGYGAE